MKIHSIDNTKFGLNYRLAESTLKMISDSTKLSVYELHRLPFDEAAKLMKERGALKEPSKLKQWFAEKYRQFGEKLGLLKKQVNFYTDID